MIFFVYCYTTKYRILQTFIRYIRFVVKILLKHYYYDPFTSLQRLILFPQEVAPTKRI